MVSSSWAISSRVAIAFTRSASGSIVSRRIRIDARGVRRSWPIAPSMTSFSRRRASTRRFMALNAEMALRTSSGPLKGRSPPPSPDPTLALASARSRSGRDRRREIQRAAVRTLANRISVLAPRLSMSSPAGSRIRKEAFTQRPSSSRADSATSRPAGRFPGRRRTSRILSRGRSPTLRVAAATSSTLTSASSKAWRRRRSSWP